MGDDQKESANPLVKRIDKKLVHKIFNKNVFISDLHALGENSDEFECQMIVDQSHPFFFEHPLDHIPGMMFIEAGGQAGIAGSHLFFGIPFGTQFVSKECNVRFIDFAEIKQPVHMLLRFKDKVLRDGVILEAKLDTEFYQGEALVCSMTGDWKMFPREIYERFRSKQKPIGESH